MKKKMSIFLVLAALTSFGGSPSFASDAEVAARLQAIENKQNKILADLETLKSELQIVKIRITSSR